VNFSKAYTGNYPKSEAYFTFNPQILTQGTVTTLAARMRGLLIFLWRFRCGVIGKSAVGGNESAHTHSETANTIRLTTLICRRSNKNSPLVC
jgi:hypothetical protein